MTNELDAPVAGLVGAKASSAEARPGGPAWYYTGCVIALKSVAPPLVVCAAVLIGCGGSVTDGSGGQNRGREGVGGTEAGGSTTDGGSTSTANGGRSGNLPYSTPEASAPDASTDAATATEGGTPVCPIRVSGTLLTEADCYACILPGCMMPAIGKPLTPEACVGLLTTFPGAFSCAWYADGVPVDGPGGHVADCKSNVGRVVCEGGL